MKERTKILFLSWTTDIDITWLKSSNFVGFHLVDNQWIGPKIYTAVKSLTYFYFPLVLAPRWYCFSCSLQVKRLLWRWLFSAWDRRHLLPSLLVESLCSHFPLRERSRMWEQKYYEPSSEYNVTIVSLTLLWKM